MFRLLALLLVSKQARESVDAQLPPLVYVCTMGIGGAKITTLHVISARESHITQISISCTVQFTATQTAFVRKLGPLTTRTEMALVEHTMSVEKEETDEEETSTQRGVLDAEVGSNTYPWYRPGFYLERIKKKESQECWWCQHERQTRDHLFKWCKKWKRQQDVLWEKLKVKCKWKEGRTKVPMSQAFDTDEAVEPMLEFLADTDVGRVTGVRDDEEQAEVGGSSDEE
ncbi:hypothetical protein BDD12DRAFT_889802 [Trichophaea hybrida]|nr:hypothetical protein BDD12DRAFT_889802 [Trichophaea hybrida]